MHAHGRQGRKLGREKDQRRALLKGLSRSLIHYGQIETTLEKAKDLRPYVERLVTKAKKGDLANRRRIISSLGDKQAAHKLVDEIAPKHKSREGGYLTIERTYLRRGDNAQMAEISFVESKQAAEKPKAPAAQKAATNSAQGGNK